MFPFQNLIRQGRVRSRGVIDSALQTSANPSPIPANLLYSLPVRSPVTKPAVRCCQKSGIGINHLVLAKDDSQWGAFWEAITVEKAVDLFKLCWREKYAANV